MTGLCSLRLRIAEECVVVVVGGGGGGGGCLN